MSLGVDLVPKKVCSLDCVYCEVGKTSKLTGERKEYVLFDRVVEELRNYFEDNPDPDFITFSGSGEPTLNSRLGDVIAFIKDIRPDIPIAVLTNGTLLSDKGVQEELKDVEIVLPSLDAVSDDVFRKINRPAEGFDIESIIDGLAEFRKVFRGKIWLEVFILPDYNLDDSELEKFRKVISRINPDSIQLNTLDRPGTESGINAASRIELERIKETWGLANVEIIAKSKPKKDLTSYRKDTMNAILSTISRRPCTVEDLAKIFGMPIVGVNKYLRVLEAEGKVEAQQQDRGIFYKTP